MRIAVLTSGGDAPGMNAAIRAVVRTGISRGFAVVGVARGFAGLMDGEFRELLARDVGNILNRGGTMLGSARSDAFKTAAGRDRALLKLRDAAIDALVVIGGNGSQSGAAQLSALGFPVVGVASTIDNDLAGSEPSIGVATALDVVLEAADRLRVTASSHQRAFLIEVMGRDYGYLALVAAIASGAEVAVIPEAPMNANELAKRIREAYQRGKPHAIVIVAEGTAGGADGLARDLDREHPDLGFDLRVTRLGHTQRGGAPGVADRLLATLLGDAATECLARGEHGVLVGMRMGEIATTPYATLATLRKPLDLKLLDLLARLTL